MVSMYSSIQRSLQKAQSDITKKLYSCTVDSDIGVVHDLIDSMEEQEVKEAMMGYWALLQPASRSCRGRGKSEQDVDETCEHFLRERFGVDVDFEVDDSLGKLLNDGLAV